MIGNIEALRLHLGFCRWLREIEDSNGWSPELMQYRSVLVRLYKPLEYCALLFIDLLNLIEALKFAPYAEEPDFYRVTIVKQIVLLLYEFQDKLNQGILGPDFWSGVEQLAELFGTGICETVSSSLRDLLREYNREMEPHRQYLTKLRNEIVAHRSLDLDRYYELHLQIDIERIRKINLRTLEFYLAFQAATDEALRQGLERFGVPPQ